MEAKLMNLCLIENDKGEVLVQVRIKRWTGIAFPGGKIEPCESIVESTKREVKEETGLAITDLKLCGIKTWFDIDEKITNVVFCFRTNNYKGKLIEECEEGKHYWVKKDDVRNLEMADTFEATLDLYDTDMTEILWRKANDVWEEIRY